MIQNAAGSVTSAEAALVVVVPWRLPRIPRAKNVSVGSSVTFSVSASSDTALSYQWQKNGQRIDGATGSSLTLANVQAGDAGSYSVVIENSAGAVTSQLAVLTLILPQLQGGRTAEQAPPPIETRQGIFDGGSNAASSGAVVRRSSTPNTGEDRWFSWKAPASGIVTFSTDGSTFDTELAIYTGTPPNNLTLAGSDDDRGGFFRSEVKLNAVQGTTYLIKVAGFHGATGRIVGISGSTKRACDCPC